MLPDEPTHGPGPQGRADRGELIVALGQGQRTVLISSHLLNEVELMCTRVGVIRKGQMVAEGTIDELRGAAHLSVRAEPADRARALLEAEAGASAVSVDGDGAFRVALDVSRAAEINRKLVEAGIAVSELTSGERSLEEVFMELTGTEGGL